MALTNTPFGMLARWHPSGQARSNAYENVLLSGQTTNIYYGTPVVMATGAASTTVGVIPGFVISSGAYVSAGTLPVGVTVATGQSILIPVCNPSATNMCQILGSFAGVEYTDLNGRRQYSKFWTSGLTTYPGTQTLAYVWDDPENVYEIAFDGALNTGSNSFQYYCKQTNLNISDTGFTTGTSVLPAGNAVPVGQSAQRASATLTTATQFGQLEIVSSFGLSSPTTQMTDAFPTQYVKVAAHQLRARTASL